RAAPVKGPPRAAITADRTLSGAPAQHAFHTRRYRKMANPFTYLELHSTDTGKARAFYSELFGWKTDEIAVPGGSYTEIHTHEGPPAGLTAQRQPQAGSAWLAYVRVPRLDEALTRAQKLGGR